MVERTTNAQLRSELGELRLEIGKINEGLARIGNTLAEVQAMQRTESARCPYREDIARAVNGMEAVKKFDDRLRRVEVKVASIAAIIGILTGVVSSFITTLLTRGI